MSPWIGPLLAVLGPVFTIGFGAMLLGERVNLLQLAGVALVLGDVMLVSRAPRTSIAPAKAGNTARGGAA